MGDWDQADNPVLELLKQVMAQNQQLIDALTKTSPVEVLRAMNPAPVYLRQVGDSYEQDAPKQPIEDPWGDPNLSNEEVLAHTSGWVDPPFKDKEVGDGETPAGQPDTGQIAS